MNETVQNAVTERPVRERLISLVRNILGGTGATRPLAIDARLSDLGMSSIKMVNLMLAIEVEFDLTIPQSEITPGNFESIASVEALVVKVADSAPGL
jgi:acyl carrier protein